MKATNLIVAASCLFIAGSAVPARAADDHDKKVVVVQGEPDRQYIWVQKKAKHWDSEHKTWVERGGYPGYRVPDDKFIVYFGPQHTFRINTLPIRMVQNEPYYQYNGYWMRVVDPWPESWPEGWYDSDDVYVVNEQGGYYLYNRKYPGIALSLEFTDLH